MELDRAKRFYEGRRILVTGGAGAIGSNLVRELLSFGPELVVVLDDLSQGKEWVLPSSERLLFVKGKVEDEEALKRVFLEAPSIVFHLAASFANQRSIDYPEADLSTNGLGTLRVLEYSSLAGVERLVYTSSGCAAEARERPGPRGVIEITEEMGPVRPSSPYQITKYLGELYCRYFHAQRGLPVVMARPFNCYGPGEIPGQYRNVVANFVFWAMLGKPLVVTGDGSESRDFTYVRDAARALALLGARDEAVGETINVASGREVRIAEVAETVVRLAGSRSKIV